jgi:hypothetical protein
MLRTAAAVAAAVARCIMSFFVLCVKCHLSLSAKSACPSQAEMYQLLMFLLLSSALRGLRGGHMSFRVIPNPGCVRVMEPPLA